MRGVLEDPAGWRMLERAFDKKSLAGDSEEADPMDRDRHGLLELPVD